MKKKIFVPGATKVLLALTSLAGTVGLWNVISNQSLAAAQKANETVDLPSSLAPLPTVIPLVQVTPQNVVPDQSASGAAATLRKVAPQPVNPAPNASAAVQAPAIIPNPVTTTGSSK
ncbi:MAG: hypothetical protein ABFD24_01965 [Anaerolineaceae bacterium]|jgi:hypothetical protein